MTSNISLPFARLAILSLLQGEAFDEGAGAIAREKDMCDALLKVLNRGKIVDRPALADLVGSLGDDICGHVS